MADAAAESGVGAERGIGVASAIATEADAGADTRTCAGSTASSATGAKIARAATEGRRVDASPCSTMAATSLSPLLRADGSARPRWERRRGPAGRADSRSRLPCPRRGRRRARSRRRTPRRRPAWEPRPRWRGPSRSPTDRAARRRSARQRSRAGAGPYRRSRSWETRGGGSPKRSSKIIRRGRPGRPGCPSCVRPEAPSRAPARS